MHTILSQDVSIEGWETVETFEGNIKANGRWNQEEKVYHINYLELLAIWYALKGLYVNTKTVYMYKY